MSAGITAVPGVELGHWTDAGATTGVTVLVFPGGARGGVWVPGSATATRELGPLDPTALAGTVHALCLCGGSALGLAAADGVVRALAARGVGFDAGAGVRVPIVPAAALFDLHGSAGAPGAPAGEAALRAASPGPVARGRVGAGAGGTVGKAHGNVAPGGFGSTSARVGPWTVGAIAAVNAAGGVKDGGRWVAGGPIGDALPTAAGDWRGQTTLVAVATDAPLDRARCHVLARMATAGVARAIAPAFGPFDGDTVFAVSTGSGEPLDALALLRLGDAAATAVERAIVDAVR